MITTIDRALTLATRTDNLKSWRDFVATAVADAGIVAAQGRRLVLALDEAITSVVTNAKVRGAGSEVTVLLDVNETRFRAVLREQGNGFGDDELDGDAIRREAERFRGHELSTFLLLHLMDEVNYRFKRGFQNELELIKFLNS